MCRGGVVCWTASTSRALACLETLVHLGAAGLPLNRYLVEIRVPESDWSSRTIFEPKRHVGWDAEPPGLVSLEWGNDWSSTGSSLLAQVPSVVVPEEANVLINSRHPHARAVRARKLRRWSYDARLRAEGQGS